MIEGQYVGDELIEKVKVDIRKFNNKTGIATVNPDDKNAKKLIRHFMRTEPDHWVRKMSQKLDDMEARAERAAELETDDL